MAAIDAGVRAYVSRSLLLSEQLTASLRADCAGILRRLQACAAAEEGRARPLELSALEESLQELLDEPVAAVGRQEGAPPVTRGHCFTKVIIPTLA